MYRSYLDVTDTEALGVWEVGKSISNDFRMLELEKIIILKEKEKKPEKRRVKEWERRNVMPKFTS